MILLREVTRPKDPTHIRASRILETEEWFNDDRRVDLEDKEVLIDSEIGIAVVPRPQDEENQELFLFFVGIPGLQEWEFHQYDDDFFPSIPHGHLKGRNQPKLDSYLGWVYQGSKQTKRVNRFLIVKMWNDQVFRDFAAIAVDYYLTHHPHYKGWRVPNPRKLPRKR